MHHVAIIGNGVAGTTAARHIRKMSQHAITMISSESDHFYARTALMYIYMGHLTYENTKPYEDWFWAKNRIDLVRGHVEEVDIVGKRLLLRDGRSIAYDTLVVATGSTVNNGGWPGEDADGVQGLYGLDDLERMQRHTRAIERGVVVGGGLIGVEVAEMLRARGIAVTFLMREQTYLSSLLPVEEGTIVNRHLIQHGVDLRAGTMLREILADENGHVRAILTDAGEEIACGFVALTIGVRPNIDLARRSGVETARGILVDDFFRTTVPDVYAVGDCAEFRSVPPGVAPVEQLWYTGRRHGEIAARNICGESVRYERGVWFNSAKFFDIEYQTYGRISPKPAEGEETIYWEHPDGRRCIRINYDAGTRQVLGFNLLGVRYRHAICDAWIGEGRTIEHVLENLAAASFDPEFHSRFERHIVQTYNSSNGGSPVAPGRRRGLLRNLFG